MLFLPPLRCGLDNLTTPAPRLGFPTYELAVILIDPAFRPRGRSVGCARCGGAFAQIGEYKGRTVQPTRARAALDLGRGSPVLPIGFWRSADRPFAIVSVLDHVSSPSVSRGEKTA
jgi:hypothetical protein